MKREKTMAAGHTFKPAEHDAILEFYGPIKGAEILGIKPLEAALEAGNGDARPPRYTNMKTIDRVTFLEAMNYHERGLISKACFDGICEARINAYLATAPAALERFSSAAKEAGAALNSFSTACKAAKNEGAGGRFGKQPSAGRL